MKLFFSSILSSLLMVFFSGCAISPRSTDLHGVLLDLSPNDRLHPNAGGSGVGRALLSGGLFAGPLLAQVGKAIVVDSVVKASPNESSQKERKTIYNSYSCDATVKLPNQEIIKIEVECWYLVRTKAHAPGSIVYVRYGNDMRPYVPHLAL